MQACHPSVTRSGDSRALKLSISGKSKDSARILPHLVCLFCPSYEAGTGISTVDSLVAGQALRHKRGTSSILLRKLWSHKETDMYSSYCKLNNK